MATPRQRTLGSATEISGVGLHTGEPVQLRLLPADSDTGIVFRVGGASEPVEIAARVGNVVGTDRGTTLARGEVKVQTVEHLLAALGGAGIDNAIVEVDGPELPAVDGSARPFLRMLEEVGTRELGGKAGVLEIREPLTVADGESRYVVTPASGFEVSTTIDFPHPIIGRQFASFEVSAEIFAREIAPARTFARVDEVEALRERGLARGGTPENALALTDDGLLEGQELRFPDEFVRHKMLDLIGDLTLVGLRIRGHVFAQRPGHRGNVALARALHRVAEGQGLVGPVLDIQEILKYLPHRYPLLLVDRVIAFEERKRIVGIKNVTINEPFFVGHFPGKPIMPGVLIVEAMAQVGGLLLKDSIDSMEDKVILFMSLDNVKWRRPVVPGDQIRFEVELTQSRGRTARMKGVGTVDGQTVAEAEMMARVVDR